MQCHFNDVIMGTIASQLTSLTFVYSTVYSDADQRKHQNSASLAFVWGIHRRPVNSPHKWPVTRKMFPFDEVIMFIHYWWTIMGMATWYSKLIDICIYQCISALLNSITIVRVGVGRRINVYSLIVVKAWTVILSHRMLTRKPQSMQFCEINSHLPA